MLIFLRFYGVLYWVLENLSCRLCLVINFLCDFFEFFSFLKFFLG